MDRTAIINKVGISYHKSNIEAGEFSYVSEAGSMKKLEKLLGKKPKHYKIDVRFEYQGVSVLIETKQKFVSEDEKQLADYVEEERALFPSNKIIAILANTTANDDIKVWKDAVNEESLLKDEVILQDIMHYVKIFKIEKNNNKALVMQNTFKLNEKLHKYDIDEKIRSQFVGTCLLYIKSLISSLNLQSSYIDKNTLNMIHDKLKGLSTSQIISNMKGELEKLINDKDSYKKLKKIEILHEKVLGEQCIKSLSEREIMSVLDSVTIDIYKYINEDTDEGQDILNLFFTTFNKYVGKADKNQAFTPDHITHFMCKITGVDRTKHVLDYCTGSGAFLVQAMMQEFYDCRKLPDKDREKAIENIKRNNIWGIESEEKAFGLATTNMLVHSDGNSNIYLGSCFDLEEKIIESDPDIILLNPPYNAKPRTIPDKYKTDWGKAIDGKEDPTKGLVFVKYISDIIKKIDKKGVKMAVLLPMQCAIGTSQILKDLKSKILEDNTLEAVFSLPDDMFYPGASVCACCMLLTLNQTHEKDYETYFGYYKDDGFKKKKNLGRVEQFDCEGNSIWKKIEEQWIISYKNKVSKDGFSSKKYVTGEDEWLCEAYMKTDYSKLTNSDFQQTVNDYLAFLVKEGEAYESKD